MAIALVSVTQATVVIAPEKVNLSSSAVIMKPLQEPEHRACSVS